MQSHTHTPLAILALNIEDASNELSIVRSNLGNDARPVEGVYKGKHERAYIVPLIDTTLNDVLKLAREFDQESILFLDNQRQGWLHYCDRCLSDYLGTFKEVSPMVADTLDTYTKDGVKYYACRW